ncbi:MAG: L-histidine N(alpha)-methyltransferase [Angustibacter sp.]
MTITLHSHLAATSRREALAADVRVGLAQTPKSLPPKWFYDQRGSELFDRITRLPEYYLTRAERQVLRARAGEIAALTQADTLVELGSGTSDKTRLLLDALRDNGTLQAFVPFDVDQSVLDQAGRAIADRYPGLDVQAVVGDFERHLGQLPVRGRRLVVFLGSTIGNLVPSQRRAFLAALRAGLRDGDAFLLGVDVVKDPARLVAAYDDSQGVTAAFNRNVLRVLRRELGADVDPDRFTHVARWNAERKWIEMWLRSAVPQRIRVPAVGVDVTLDAGEEVLTEVSAKFREEGVRAELEEAGLRMVRWWTDSPGDFAVCLAVPGSAALPSVRRVMA